MSNRVERNPSLAIVGEVADEPGGWLIRRRIEGLPPGLPPDRVTSAVLLVHQRMVVGADMKDTFASVLLAGVTLDLGLRMPKPAGIHAVEDQVHLAGCGAAGLRPMRSLTYRPPLQR